MNDWVSHFGSQENMAELNIGRDKEGRCYIQRVGNRVVYSVSPYRIKAIENIFESDG